MGKQSSLLLALAMALPAASAISAQTQPAPTTDTAPAQADIDSLVADLGSSRYEVREQAGRRLRQIGLSAVGALERATASDDPEVRLRARDILEDLRLGIGPDWTAEMVQLVKGYQQLPPPRSGQVLRQITDQLKEQAVPLLLNCMTSQDVQEASSALQCLKSIAGEEVHRKVLQSLRKPANAAQAEAMAWSLGHSNRGVDAMRLVDQFTLGRNVRQEAVEATVKQFMAMLKDYQFRQVAQQAVAMGKADEQDARLLYLQAEALLALDRDQEAQSLRESALAKDPADEAPHFQAGEMLQNMGRRCLAEQEWKKILQIPPAGGVYDINAYLRLGTIYAAGRLYQQAADSLQKAMDLYILPGGGTVGALAGGSEEDVRRQIAGYRVQARRFPPRPGQAVVDELPDKHVNIAIEVFAKDGDVKELAKELRACAATLTANVEPRGLRLLDEAKVAVLYDKQAQTVRLELNGSLVGKAMPMKIAGGHVTVAVNSLDCCYIYRVDAAGGPAVRLKRFEKDYRVRFRPGVKVAAYEDVRAFINDKEYAWKDLLAGMKFDYLPKAFQVRLEGIGPAGEPVKVEFNMPLAEPDVRRLIGPAKPDDDQPDTRPANSGPAASQPAEEDSTGL